jgi:ribosomal protein S18 acetylase RimI-like enzyme
LCRVFEQRGITAEADVGDDVGHLRYDVRVGRRWRPLEARRAFLVARINEGEHRGTLGAVNDAPMHIEPVAPDRLLDDLFDPVIKIWMAAMHHPSDHPRAQRFGEALERHTARADFRCLVAFARDGLPVGFTYGYTGRAGQWWTDLVSAALDQDARRHWLNGHFELVEIHVHPERQGNGIGGRLHDAVLDGLPNETALLSTHRGPTAAFALYRKRGWDTLVEHFSFPDQNLDYRIMGLNLQERGPLP